MSFSESGGVITQTGTDTDLSGLSGITGVTTKVLGANLSIWGPKTYYDIGTHRLEVQGTLSFDANDEAIELSVRTGDSKGILVTATGSLTIAGEYDSAGQTQVNSYPLAIVSDRGSAANWFDQNNSYCLRGDSGSTINLYGVKIDTMQNISLWGSGEIRKNFWVAASNYVPLMAINSPNYTISGLEIVGSHGLIFGSDNNFTISGVSLRSADKTTQHDATGWGSPSSTTSYPTFVDYQKAGGTQPDFKYWWNGPYKFKNAVEGSDLNTDNSVGNSLANGFGLITKEFSINVTDSSKTPIENVKVYSEDQDNGSRRRIVEDCGFTNFTGLPDFSQTQVYQDTTDVNGDTGSIEVYLAVHTHIAADLTAAGNWDYRFLNDEASVKLISYQHILATTTLNLKGAGQLQAAGLMFTDLSVSETTKATVDAYTDIETPEKFYDRAKSYLYDNYAGESSTIVSRSGSTIDAGSYNVTIDATAGSAFAVAGSTITIKASAFAGTINTTGTLTLANGSIINGSFTNISIDFATAGTYNLQNSTFSGTLTVSNSSGGAVTVKVLPGTTVVNNGPNITVDDTETGLVTAPNIIDGSRYQLYNVTQTNEIANGLVSGGSGLSLSVTLGAGQDALPGDTIRLRVTYQSGTSAKNGVESTALITSAGVTFLDSQTDNEVYNSYGIDGSTITQFSADYVADEVDITVASNFNGKDFYSWWVYNETTAQGIDEFFGVLTALDQANLRINSSLLNVFIDNTTSTNIWQTDNVRIFREDGNYPVKNPATSGGGGVDMVWRNQIFIAETGVSGLTASESSTLLAIPTNPLLNNDVRLDNLDATISSRSTFNASNDEVTTDSASRTASQATGFATPANVTATQTAIQSDINNLNDISPGEVNAEVDIALADYDGPTKAEMDAAFNEIKGTGWTDETLKDIRDNVSTVDLGTMPSEVTAIKLKTDNLNFIGNDVQSVSSNMRGTDGANTVTPTTTVDLAAAQAAIQNDISNLNNPSAEEIKDTILDEVL